MSIDVSRTYVVPIERLADAFAAAAEVAVRGQEAHEYPILLPDGSSVVFPLAPVHHEPPYVLGAEGLLSFDFIFCVAGGDGIIERLEGDPERPLQVDRPKSGGTPALISLRLAASTESLYGAFTFRNTCNRDCDVLSLRSVCDVLDYFGRCADSLVTYETVMGEDRLIEPFKGALPPLAEPDSGMKLARIVEYGWTRGMA